MNIMSTELNGNAKKILGTYEAVRLSVYKQAKATCDTVG